MLASLTNASLTGGAAYKACAVAGALDSAVRSRLEAYIEARCVVLARVGLARGIADAARIVGRATIPPYGIDLISELLNIYGSAEISHVVDTATPASRPGMTLGTFMESSVVDTRSEVRVDPSSLNLGVVLAGLPGTGKTTAAMSIIDQLCRAAQEARAAPRPAIAIIATTSEWNAFGLAHRMHLVKPFSDMLPINFFASGPRASMPRFYENMAMILASAANAGPYRNPMEKCMISAFRRAYHATRCPDPVMLYNELERAIVRLHARTSGTSVKYSKHGENIRSALEGLRAMLNRREYAAREGLDLQAMARDGIVFDMSNVSATTMPYIYALTLNQIYALADSFDYMGDSSLRMLICIEEAQRLFGQKADAVVMDLENRVQDFRKQGVALMLVLHNVTDIEPSIRRLCQTKLYFKQAPDVAALSAKDLVLSMCKEPDAAASKLKRLESRVCALSYVVKDGDSKRTPETVFIRTLDYAPPNAALPPGRRACAPRQAAPPAPRLISATIALERAAQRHDKTGNLAALRVVYLGEEVLRFDADTDACTFECEMIEGKEYTLQLLDSKGKLLRSIHAIAAPRISITI